MTDYSKWTVEALIERHHSLVQNDVHKDRDCHWVIQKVWSYGEFDGYYVQHHGYVSQEVNVKCHTYRDAEAVLRKELIKAIQELMV